MIRARIELWSDRVLSISRLGRVAVHAHTGAALLVGIDGPFGFRLGLPGEKWRTVEHIVVAPGCPHELECGETLMGVLHLTPGQIDHRQLCEHAELPAFEGLHVLGPPRRRREELRAIFAGELSAAELEAWVARQVGPPPGRYASDARVEEVAALISNQPDALWRLPALAARTGVSASRLQHLFRAELGVTPRQLRTWQRLREVCRRFAEGESLTLAAHEAGFVDSAHMSRAFRHLLGIAPSRVLSGGTRLRVHEG
ncbi:helix-turn-helix transcriptional regulator [Pyxidicoccus fallax]|uniref:Helix-turn-helix transcriptional regulator n=1 Tax=Pyxidicoccus fallax TaxID=394095 RepID=A0A848LSI2_9BACT|nr:AraC family transcriptional regulator [Pyxidicoccus fallax]NMO20374.1 helix-turn-helix transcriptional regulator [Pyxidicoccus fallax]NPC83774.1 helix-turn-helix transcriptional regulator [Pyxidicoccus fallax]